MLNKNIITGSSINASKPVGVLNRPDGSRAISGKRDLVNAPLYTWFGKMIIYLKYRIYINTYVGQLFMMSIENGCK